MITVVKNPILTGDDVRAGATSASSMERIYLCRGSYLMEKNLVEPPREASVRESGSRVHGALAGELPLDVLDEDETWMYHECQSWEKEIVQVVFGGKDLIELESFTEDRLYMIETDDEGNQRIIHSGEFDKLYIDAMTGHLLILDYKTGFIPVTEPEKNYQLRSYAVLVWLYYKDKYQIKTIEVAAIQPRVRPVYVRCAYTEEDLPLAMQEMVKLMSLANKPDAPRKAGEVQCKYCKALTVCPTAREKVKAGLMHIDEILKALEKEPPIILDAAQLKRREQICSNETLAAIYEETQYIDKWRDRVKAEIIMRMQNSASIPGYELGKTPMLRKIEDVYEVRQKIDISLSPRTLDACATMSVGKLEKALGEAAGKPKKDHKQYLADTLGDLIVPGGGNVTIKRVAKEEDAA